MTCEMLRKKNGVQIALSDHLKQVRQRWRNWNQMDWYHSFSWLTHINCALTCVSRGGRSPRLSSAWSWSSLCAGCLSTSAASWNSPSTTRRIQTAVSCSGTGRRNDHVPQCNAKGDTRPRRWTDPVLLSVSSWCWTTSASTWRPWTPASIPSPSTWSASASRAASGWAVTLCAWRWSHQSLTGPQRPASLLWRHTSVLDMMTVVSCTVCVRGVYVSPRAAAQKEGGTPL